MKCSELYAYSGTRPSGNSMALHTPYGTIAVDSGDVLAFLADQLSYEDLCKRYHALAAAKYGFAEIKVELGEER